MNHTTRILLRKLTLVTLITTSAAALAQTGPGRFTTEPDKSLTAAHESFMKKDLNASAAHIHQAADYVKKQSDKVAADSKAGMEKAGDELDKFGDQVKAGIVKSDAEMKQAFAKADHQIAGCWHKTAVESRKSGKNVNADLKKAADSLTGAAKWSNTKLKEGTQSSIDAIKKAGKATGESIQADSKTVDNWFKGIGDGIEDLGKKL